MSEPINIYIPTKSCTQERRWIISIFFKEFFDIGYKLIESEEISSCLISSEKKTIILNDTFFPIAHNHWFHQKTLPTQPLKKLDFSSILIDTNITSNSIPIIYGLPEYNIENNSISIGIDIFGSSFFMLTRYEEVVKKDRDQFDRFPAKASLALQENFLDRPIINEYIELLWSAIKFLWPEFKRRKRVSQTFISADVDRPYHYLTKSLYALADQLIHDVIKKHNIINGVQNIENYLLSKLNNYKKDPFYSYFKWMMDQNEKFGHKIAFYFIVDSTDKKRDAYYNLDEKAILSLIQEIIDRGHEVGLHMSFNSYNDKHQLKKEIRKLQKVLTKLGITNRTLGGRQHYLRWSALYSPGYQDLIGLNYDTTLGYAEKPGFRCGICYEYSMYDLYNREPLKIIQRPLVLMEQSVLSSSYMGLKPDHTALNVMKKLKRICEKFQGDFTLLWHNNNFQKKSHRDIYLNIIN